ncbi:MAG TPA: beta-ketoacyl-ACP synthase II [Aggregatilineales bacterium]|nr:beta-ketoacyl-ACP synthase II [Aggregatilineales bacterium]
MERRRVVITGMGCLCPVGNSVEESWQNAAQGKSGIAPLQRIDSSNLTIHFGGEVKNFDAKAMFGHREVRRMDRVTQLAMAAAQEAIRDSGLKMENEDCYEVGVIVGSGIGGIETTLDQAIVAVEKGPRGTSPLLIPMMLPDSPSGRVAMEYGMRGPNMGISTACATGNNSIGEAVEIIRRGAATVMLGGSTEAGVVPLAIASFDNMGAVSRRNDDPATASRPFDKDRDGFVVAEGAAVLVLEELEHAKARGAKIYAEVLGYGNTDDAFHVTAPLENGEGAMTAMRKAVRNAGLELEEIDYINAHGTSTSLNDASETRALKSLLGERAYDVPISSTKSVTGHLLGGAGSVEAVFSVMAIRDQFVPPTINLFTPDPACDLNYVPNKGIPHKINNVMSNSFGFGGHNAVLVFGKYHSNGK